MSVGLSVEAITQECFYEGSRSSNITYFYENISEKFDFGSCVTKVKVTIFFYLLTKLMFNTY